jgi:hypothetical protein
MTAATQTSIRSDPFSIFPPGATNEEDEEQIVTAPAALARGRTSEDQESGGARGA